MRAFLAVEVDHASHGMSSAELSPFRSGHAVRWTLDASPVCACPVVVDGGHAFLSVFPAEFSLLGSHYAVSRMLAAAMMPAFATKVDHSFLGMRSTELSLLAARHAKRRPRAAALVPALVVTKIDHSFLGMFPAQFSPLCPRYTEKWALCTSFMWAYP